jgi:CheY-like chemotaxis protein
MPKVLLLTYDVESRDPRRKAFEEAGFAVEVEEPAWPAALEAAKRFAPDVIAVDCGQLPSHGRETAEALRTTAATNAIPVVLFRVAEHDIERTRLKVPGGVVAFDYELLDRIRSAALTRLAHLAALQPAVPDRPRPRPGAAPAAGAKAAPPKVVPAPKAAPAPVPKTGAPATEARRSAPRRPATPEPRAARPKAHEAATVKAPARPAAARSAKAPAARTATKTAARKKR